MTDYKCVNCGSFFEKEPDEDQFDSPDICGACARHYIGLIDKALGDEMTEFDKKVVEAAQTD